MKRTTIADCRTLEFPRINDPRGNLSFLEGKQHVPFTIERVFYLYDVPIGASRAGHALLSCEQVLIAISGTFEVLLNDGDNTKRVVLEQPNMGLYIPPRIWRGLENFSSGSVCLVLASEKYSERGYYDTFDEYLCAIRDTHD